MKKAVFVAGTCMMFLGVILTGCEDIEYDHDENAAGSRITATIVARVIVAEAHIYASFLRLNPYEGAVVTITFSCGGGVMQTQSRTTNAEGWTDEVTATFSVFEGQSVTVTASVSSWRGDATRTASDSKTFDWDTLWLDAFHIEGGSCTEAPELKLITLVPVF